MARVVGLSSAVLFDKVNPRNPINRRISIIVMTRVAEEAALKTDTPVVPAGEAASHDAPQDAQQDAPAAAAPGAAPMPSTASVSATATVPAAAEAAVRAAVAAADAGKPHP